MIGVIDYGAGNLGSVMNALFRLGKNPRFLRGPEELRTSGRKARFERIIFPGDGHFARTMESLTQTGYAQAICEWIAADKPFLGICIGLQLLFESSEEAPPVDGKTIKGLSVISGSVKRFPGRKVPHIGWNKTQTRQDSRLFRGLEQDMFFYYIHSYYAAPKDRIFQTASADYYLNFCSGLEMGALAALQFHPEKSGSAGIRVIENWLSY
ncbi:MAG: imidazole glycerol phosphate synthase subunit HisH [Spirochaetaceae bacterium]|jgi:imidazole glycerol phosphate synthase glutamine amidotransferase subunit|nr:imidazole glycerol phosphate synthase subunit HisH [Spirochaetaceae bacterium]